MKRKILALAIAIVLLFAAVPGLVGFSEARQPRIDYEKIIEKGFQENRELIRASPTQGMRNLANWFNQQPEVRRARLISNDITVRFIDGYAIILLDLDITGQGVLPGWGIAPTVYPTLTPSKKTCVITDALEWQGWSPSNIINPIIQDLTNAGYTVTYVINEDADLEYIEANHNKGVIYHRGHGGVFEDANGNEIVVLQTGERWVDENGDGKPDGDEYEFDQGWIFKGGISHGGTTHYFICYGPGLISAYCSNLPDSLVYMTSCDGTYNPTMANAYLGVGAKAYMGWNKPVTVNHGNKWAKEDFHMFCVDGYTVQEVVDNTPRDSWPYRAKLTHYGDGSLTLI
jgi:hypothetical protein